MFKVAAVCIDTSSESFPESKDGFIDWLLRQISPYDFQPRLEFRLVLGLGLVDSVPFQHCPPDVIVKRVEIRRGRWPYKENHGTTNALARSVLLIIHAGHLHFSNFL